MAKLIAFLSKVPWGKIAAIPQIRDLLSKYPWLSIAIALALAAMGFVGWDAATAWLAG